MNNAALRDLEKIEKYYREDAIKLRKSENWYRAEIQQACADTVRACIVTIQAAEHRKPEE